jgi:hypothetical protein
MRIPPYYPDVWPGEHYKLLAGFVEVLRPAVVVEIGTATGLGALAMLATLGAGSRLVTFDVLPWKSFPNTCFYDSDFADGRLIQCIDDLSDPLVCKRHVDLLRVPS